MTDRLVISRDIRSVLGDEVVKQLGASLLPIDCQTCGKGLAGADGLALAMDVLGDAAFAALHHEHCRSSGWRGISGTRLATPHLTWRAATFVWPAAGLPVMLVNPSCEGAFLRKEGFVRSRWRISSLDRFADNGFLRAGATSAPPLIQGLEVGFNASRVSVARLAEPPAGFLWSAAIHDDVYRMARAQGALLIGMTSALDPAYAQLTEGRLKQLVRQGEVVYAMAQITRFHRPAQKLSKDDFGSERKLNSYAAMYEMIRQKLGTDISPEVLGIADALLEGTNMTDHFRRLGRRDQILTVLLLAGVYAVQRGSVHLMTPDPASAQDYEEIFRQVLVPLKVSIERVNRAPAPARSITIGTQEQFAAAGSRPDSGQPGSGGTGAMAVIVDPGPEFLSRHFIGSYARLAEV